MIAKKVATGSEKLRPKKATKAPGAKVFADKVAGRAAQGTGDTGSHRGFPDVGAAKGSAENDHIRRNRLDDSISKPAEGKECRVAVKFDRFFGKSLTGAR